MKTSDAGIALIREFEGFSAKPYKCPGGFWTIGYGTTIGVTADRKPVTGEEAEALLRLDLARIEAAVARHVAVPINQNQFDALVSLAYNIGRAAFADSTLLRLLNQRKYYAAANQFQRWRFAGGKELPGLLRRREAEHDLFLKPTAKEG